MSRAYLLLRTQIMNYLALNEIKQSGRKKNATIMLGFGVITFILLFCTYNWFTALALVQLGKQDLIPAYMVSIASFAIFILTMLRSNGILFGSRDLDMLLALPVKFSEIITSKFLLMYLLHFLVAFVFMASGGIVWMMHTPLDMLQMVLYVISIFFVPIIPMCIASLLGLCIVYISSYFKNSNMFSLIFSFVALGVVGYVAVFILQSEAGIANVGAMLAGQITKLYPLAILFLDDARFHVSIRLGIFIALSTAVFYLFIHFVSMRYSALNDLASTSSKYKAKQKNVIKQRSPFVALYHKDFSQFFSSYTAVLNAGLGVILLSLFSIFLLLLSPEQLGKFIGMDHINRFLPTYAPVLISAMLSLSCPSAFSISLEGKHIWIVQSSPISTKKILNSKLAVNLTLHAVAYCLAIIAMMTRIQMNTLQTVSTLLIPIAYSLFSVILGLFLNKKHPNFTWDNEMIIVKQSLPVIASSLISMVVVALPVLLHWFVSFPLLPLLWGVAIVIIIASTLMYQTACRSAII